MGAPILFDAVVFDLDGTLVATERFWIAAARAGAERAFAELGIARAMPHDVEWLSMVGLPLEQGFRAVFGDLTDAQRLVVQARCSEAEAEALRNGGAALMPGALELLTELRSRGVKLGIASNCGDDYLTAMLDNLHLRDHVDQARCLDSPGIANKSDMLRDLLATFDTRSCAMVGDRAGDARAAHDNGLPHIHLTQGFAPADERIECEATVRELRQVLPVLERRAGWIESSLAQIGALRPSKRALTLGVTGGTASGKTLFARDVAKLLESKTTPASVVHLDSFLRTGAEHQTLADGAHDDHLHKAFDVERLLASVLEPRRHGEPTRHGPWGGPIPTDHVLVLEGLFLLHPRLRIALDRVIHLEVDPATQLARTAARGASPEAIARVRKDFLPAQRAFEEAIPPATRADLVLASDNPFGPDP